MKKVIIETLEKHGFEIVSIKRDTWLYFVELCHSTPEGKEWNFTIHFDGTLFKMAEALGFYKDSCIETDEETKWKKEKLHQVIYDIYTERKKSEKAFRERRKKCDKEE